MPNHHFTFPPQRRPNQPVVDPEQGSEPLGSTVTLTRNPCDHPEHPARGPGCSACRDALHSGGCLAPRCFMCGVYNVMFKFFRVPHD